MLYLVHYYFFVATKIIFIHFPALIWGSYIELTNSICPLTYLENWFLHKANLTTYSEGFIQNYLVPIVYPVSLTKDLQIYLGIALIVINIVFYAFIFNKLKKKFLNEKTFRDRGSGLKLNFYVRNIHSNICFIFYCYRPFR